MSTRTKRILFWTPRVLLTRGQRGRNLTPRGLVRADETPPAEVSWVSPRTVVAVLGLKERCQLTSEGLGWSSCRSTPIQ